jgi:hypothetical protein
MLPVVLYGRETRSLTLREEHRVRVFQNRALRKMFVQTSDDVKESWRRVYNDKFRNLYA